MPATPLYAMYVQATRVNRGTTKTMRKQWMVLPPLTREVADRIGVEPREDKFLMFHRAQSSPENRTAWRWESPEIALLERDLPEKLNGLVRENDNLPEENQWQISPVITAEVTPTELSAWTSQPRTPYPLIERFAKVAKRRYNIAI